MTEFSYLNNFGIWQLTAKITQCLVINIFSFCLSRFVLTGDWGNVIFIIYLLILIFHNNKQKQWLAECIEQQGAKFQRIWKDWYQFVHQPSIDFYTYHLCNSPATTQNSGLSNITRHRNIFHSQKVRRLHISHIFISHTYSRYKEIFTDWCSAWVKETTYLHYAKCMKHVVVDKNSSNGFVNSFSCKFCMFKWMTDC